MARRGSTLGYETTLMYGRYREDLGQFARSHAQKLDDILKREEKTSSQKGLRKYKNAWKSTITDYLSWFWSYTFARVGEDWLFLALLGIIMALLSYLMERVVFLCSRTRLWLYDLSGDHIAAQYFAWTSSCIILICFSSGFVHLVAPQAAGSGIPEIKTILRGVVLKEYLTFKTLVAKMVGLTFTLGSGLPLGKEGPFVHIAAIVATLLSKLITSFKGIYENESRTGEMLAAATAVGVASTFYSPIGGVLFSIEVTSEFFAVRNYWRGFFAACCGATVWRLLGVWIHAKEMTITALFSTSFRSDFPFDIQELFVFALIGAVCGFAGAGYVAFHRKIVQFNRRHKRWSAFLQKNRFLYPGIVAFIVSSSTFPGFLGKYTAATLSTHDSVIELFSNETWYLMNRTEPIASHWTTEDTGIFFHLSFYIFMLWWTSALASTIPVPSGLFIPVFKMGAAFGRLVGESLAYTFPAGISFAGYNNPIVPGGYAVVGAAAFAGAVTHTISTTVIVFELTGQMTHIIPVIISVLIANAIAQSLKPSIYDSIIQIKKLPFLPSITSTSSAAHSIRVEDIMIRDVVYIWRQCTYRALRNVLKSHRQIQSFPLVESPNSMILLGSVQRHQLQAQLSRKLGRERRLQEVQRRYSTQDALRMVPQFREVAERFAASTTSLVEEAGHVSAPLVAASTSSATPTTSSAPMTSVSTSVAGPSGASGPRRTSRFEVTPVGQQVTSTTDGRIKFSLTPPRTPRSGSPPPNPSSPGSLRASPRAPSKSILKQTVAFTYSPHSTLSHDSRLRQAFENIFLKSLNLKDADNKTNQTRSASAPSTPSIQRRVQLPRERVIDMSPEEQLAWEEEQLNSPVDFSQVQIDPAPFQLVEHTSLLKVHSLFSMLQLNHAYVTSIGKLVGVVALKDLRTSIEKMNNGTLLPRPSRANLSFMNSDPVYEDTVTSMGTSIESERMIDMTIDDKGSKAQGEA